MSTIIRDNRSAKGATNGSRQRFLRRHSKNIKRAVQKSLNQDSIKDIGEGGIDITIPKRDMSEPTITHDPRTGRRQGVHPGNKKFVPGHREQRPEGGGGGAGSQASNQGDGEDDFTFHLSEEEFYNFLFEGLELPNLNKAGQQDSTRTKSERSGTVSDGTPNNLDLVRSIKKRMGRGFAFKGKQNAELVSLWEQKLSILNEYNDQALSAFERSIANETLTNGIKIKKIEKCIAKFTKDFNDASLKDYLGDTTELDQQINKLTQEKSQAVPWNEIDLRYRNFESKPIKVSKAVMFCIMDVSGSMDQNTKDNAKLFYILLHKFLKKHYEQTDVIFVRHHTDAKEVDETEFFYGRETGGTVVSSGLHKMLEIIEDRYPETEWNIYGAQASDGDNWKDDSALCIPLMEQIINKSQGYWYTEITTGPPQELWRTYTNIAETHPDKFWMAKIENRSDIPTVFREFFRKRGERVNTMSLKAPTIAI